MILANSLKGISVVTMNKDLDGFIVVKIHVSNKDRANLPSRCRFWQRPGPAKSRAKASFHVNL